MNTSCLVHARGKQITAPKKKKKKKKKNIITKIKKKIPIL